MEMAPGAVVRERIVDELHADAALVAARLNRVTSDLVELSVRLLKDDLWAGGGILTPEHWLVVRAGLSQSHARDVVQLARRRHDLPHLTQAHRDGQLSLDQAVVVARHVPSQHEEAATELAVHATVPQLRRALARYVFTEDAPTAPPAATDPPAVPSPPAPPVPDGAETIGSATWARKPPELSMGYDHGRFTLRFSAPADLGALVEQALLEAKDALFTVGCDADPSSTPGRVAPGHPTLGSSTGPLGPRGHAAAEVVPGRRITLADAFLEIANRPLSGIVSTSRASKYRVYLHLDTAQTGLAGSAGTTGWVNAASPIPPSLAAKHLCDGHLQPLWLTEGTPVSVGRTQRIVPDRTRRLVEDRDRACRYPGCPVTGHVEIHHLVHWQDGGPTDLDNLLALCDRHHDAHHRGEFTMRGDPSSTAGLTFRGERGRLLNTHPPRPGPPEAPGPAMFAEADLAWGNDLAPYDGPTGERLRLRDVYL